MASKAMSVNIIRLSIKLPCTYSIISSFEWEQSDSQGKIVAVGEL